MIGLTASSTTSFTVRSRPMSGSCGTNPTVAPGRSHASPANVVSWPAMMRSSVLLPIPFGPMTPIFAPGRNER